MYRISFVLYVVCTTQPNTAINIKLTPFLTLVGHKSYFDIYSKIIARHGTAHHLVGRWSDTQQFVPRSIEHRTPYFSFDFLFIRTRTQHTNRPFSVLSVLFSNSFFGTDFCPSIMALTNKMVDWFSIEKSSIDFLPLSLSSPLLSFNRFQNEKEKTFSSRISASNRFVCPVSSRLGCLTKELSQ